MYLYIKRALDIVVSVLLFIFFLPFAIMVGILVFIETNRPFFFIQERMGKNKKIFKMYKFRSMVHNAEHKTGPVWAKKNDPRITQVGRVIRPLRLDEIPQLVNVIKGNMSLIGPRPERPFFISELEARIPDYDRRFQLKPGLTGLAQVEHKYDSNLEDAEKKVQYDFHYINHISCGLDLRILGKTIWVMLCGKGAH